MRTKTLLLTAAVTAVGIATSTAQVFSVNTVGYVRRDAPPGFSIIANPLKNGANKISDLFAGAPNGFVVYKFDNASSSYLVNTYDADIQLWDDPDQTLIPGEAAFVKNPSAAAVTFTFVGEVPEGTLNTPLPKGFNLAASQVPQAGLLETDLKFPAVEGDTVYRYRNGGYLINFHEGPGIGWNEEPTVEVGEGFFVLKANTGSVWTRTFTVN